MITLLYPYNFTQVAALLIPRINSKLFVDNIENALIRIPLHRVIGAVPSLPRRSAMMVTMARRLTTAGCGPGGEDPSCILF